MQIYSDINGYLEIDLREPLSIKTIWISCYYYFTGVSIFLLYRLIINYTCILDQKLCQTRTSVILQLTWIGANGAIRWRVVMVHPIRFVLVRGVS